MTGDEEEGAEPDEGGTAETTTNSAPEIETEAREMGWKPQSEWKGKAEDWKDAGTWVSKGKEILPIVNSELRKSKAEVAELKESFKRLETMGEKTLARELERQRVQLTEKFEAQKEDAVRLGDTDAYKEANRAQKAALKSLDEEAKDKIDEAPTAPARISPAEQKVFTNWLADNQWMKRKRLRDALDDNYDDVDEEMPGAGFAEKLEEAKRRTASEFPGKFGKKQSNGSGRNTVEGGSRSATGNSKPSERLNAFEREAAQKSVAKGEYKTVDEWAKVYYE